MPPEQQEVIAQVLAAVLSPAQVAEASLDAIEEGRFYVLTHPEMYEAVRARLDGVAEAL